ncbi:hypothetical protein [Alkaliphilus sp. B6464]|uniref:hypothetical protein n=1 Tax=Alkaliphilus sp. B6464 TaxID=2731219 RepID=UPI001BA6F3DE|nr:hypothetical protein [Alkaliphilus sp. B6464]QUH21971.1 hypothetical protein HYG84_18880 [Alkaliphilus sp. B6464]
MKKEKVFVNVLGWEFKMVMTNRAYDTCPSIAENSESDDLFVLNNLKLFLENAKSVDLEGIKANQRFIINNGIYAAELVIGTEIVVTKFIEQNQLQRYINKYSTTVFNLNSKDLAI